MKRWMSSVTLVLAFCLVGCSGKKEAPTGGGEKPAKEAAVAPTPTPDPNHVETTQFRFGRVLGPDGMVTGEGGPFAQGETLHTSFRVSRAPAGSVYKVVVTGIADGKQFYEEQKAPPANSGIMSFSLPDTRTWPVGDYRLEMVYVNGADRLRGTFDFRIVSPKK